MAMHTGEIAELAQVDLKNFWMSATEQDRMLGKFLGEPIHPMRNYQQLPPWRHLFFVSVVTPALRHPKETNGPLVSVPSEVIIFDAKV
jgi:hypothetical protein